MYRDKEKAPKSERKSPEQQEETEDDLIVSSPTPAVETAESGEEKAPAEGEGTGEEIPVTEQKVEGDDDKITEVKMNENDVETKPGEGDDAKKDQEKATKEEQEKEKDEQEQKEERVKKVVPKSELINSATCTAKYRNE